MFEAAKKSAEYSKTVRTSLAREVILKQRNNGDKSRPRLSGGYVGIMSAMIAALTVALRS